MITLDYEKVKDNNDVPTRHFLWGLTITEGMIVYPD